MREKREERKNMREKRKTGKYMTGPDKITKKNVKDKKKGTVKKEAEG